MAILTESLREKQSRFVLMVAGLIQFAYDQGYELTFGEAWRSEWEATRLAQNKLGIKRSLHRDRLAVDFNLFKDGKWLARSEDHTILGEFWEAQGGTWGGRFGDGNHYSLEHEGRK